MKTYSINLMWIANELSLDHQYICSDSNVRKISLSLQRWLLANPEPDAAVIKLWYDGETVSPKQIENTRKYLEEGITHRCRLENIRNICIVASNHAAFSQGINLYVKIDMLKIAICFHELTSADVSSVIFTDVEVGEGRALLGGRNTSRPLTPEAKIKLKQALMYEPIVHDAEDAQASDRMGCDELFDPKIMTSPTSGPLRLGLSVGDANPENQFIQMANSPVAIKAVQIILNAYLHHVQETLTKYTETEGRKAAFNTMGRFAFNLTMLYLPRLCRLSMERLQTVDHRSLASITTCGGKEYSLYRKVHPWRMGRPHNPGDPGFVAISDGYVYPEEYKLTLVTVPGTFDDKPSYGPRT